MLLQRLQDPLEDYSIIDLTTAEGKHRKQVEKENRGGIFSDIRVPFLAEKAFILIWLETAKKAAAIP